jgi:hypothetical protein
MSVAEPLEEARENLAEANQKTPKGWKEEIDATGQRWRVYLDGGRIKMGNPVRNNLSPGRPKDAVRELYLRNAEVAAKRDAKVLMSDRPDDDPAVERAKERSARIGVGTQDEKVVIKDPRVFEAMARAAAKLNLPADLADEYLNAVLEDLGMPQE